VTETDSPELPYVQIAESMREQIETGRLKPGDKLPSNRELMDEWKAGSQTVQRAVRALKEAGLVETRASRGVFVRPRRKSVERSADYNIAPSPGGNAYKATSRRLLIGPVAAVPYVAEAFGFEVGTEVFCRARLMVRDEEPIELVTSWYPMNVADGTELAEDRGLKGGSPAALQRLGFGGVRSSELVYTRLPLPSEIRLLRLTSTTPVFRILRTVFAAGDRPVEVLEMVLSGDVNVLRYDM
jgi:GntR family transcriptional regulator